MTKSTSEHTTRHERTTRRRLLQVAAGGAGTIGAVSLFGRMPTAFGIGNASQDGHDDATPDGGAPHGHDDATPDADASPGASPAASPAAEGEAAVSISNFAFDPAELSIAVGTTVTWTNNDNVPHTATGNDRDVLQSGTIQPGATFSQVFDTAGTVDYFCELHENMSATIIVS